MTPSPRSRTRAPRPRALTWLATAALLAGGTLTGCQGDKTTVVQVASVVARIAVPGTSAAATTSAAVVATVKIEFETDISDLDLFIEDDFGTEITESAGDTDVESVCFFAAAGEQRIIHVESFDGFIDTEGRPFDFLEITPVVNGQTSSTLATLDEEQTLGGSYDTFVIDGPPGLQPGDTLQLRLRFRSDDQLENEGVYLDNFRILGAP